MFIITTNNISHFLDILLSFHNTKLVLMCDSGSQYAIKEPN